MEMLDCEDCLRIGSCRMHKFQPQILGCDKWSASTKERLEIVEEELGEWRKWRGKKKT